MEEERWDKSGEEAESPIVPPHSIDAEKSVLGAVILSKDAAELVVLVTAVAVAEAPMTSIIPITGLFFPQWRRSKTRVSP